MRSKLSEKDRTHLSKNNFSNKKHNFLYDLKKNYVMWMMILPAIVFFIIFCYLPMFGIVLAFKDFNYSDGILGSPWVGMANFKFLFMSGTLWRVTKNTFLYNVIFILVDLVAQIAIAIMLSEITRKWYKKIAQSLMFLPYFVSYVLLAAFVYNLFNYEYGVINNILVSLGMEPFDAYSNSGIWKYILVFFHEWKGLGYGVVIYLATLTGISSEFYEASKIDGANKWQEIRYITVPLLKPTVIIITLFAVGKIMKGQFELFYQIIGNNGNLYSTTDIIDTYVFRMLTQTFDPGMGTAAGLYQSVVSFILIMVVNFIVKKIEPDYSLF
ncbi:MAG: ABC transporter permease [Massiliimalia sp.]|jgi:putative aldouronate transport system permease protein